MRKSNIHLTRVPEGINKENEGQTIPRHGEPQIQEAQRVLSEQN